MEIQLVLLHSLWSLSNFKCLESYSKLEDFLSNKVYLPLLFDFCKLDLLSTIKLALFYFKFNEFKEFFLETLLLLT